MALTRAVKILVPGLPNFVRYDIPSKDDQQPSIDVADLTDQEIQQLGADWTRELMAHALRRRNARQAESRLSAKR